MVRTWEGSMDDDVLIIGAGPAGLCCAVELARRGVPATVLERSLRVGEPWRTRPDGLQLNSGRGVSALPGQRYPRSAGTFPARDDVVTYLERYAQQCPVQSGVDVEQIDPDDRGWVLATSAGTRTARHVVVATGQFARPVLPAWPGRDRFAGRLVHAAEYRNALPYRDQDVLVVGPGCSGMEIAAELAREGARSVHLAVRTPPNLMPRFFGALPGVTLLLRLPAVIGDAQARLIQALAVGDLSRYGLPRPKEGPVTQLRTRGAEPTAVDRSTLRAIRAGRIKVVPAVTGLDPAGAHLADGAHLAADAVIAATGFQPDLRGLVGHLDVLDDAGFPRPQGRLPFGLHFVGFARLPGQLVFLPGMARRLAAQIVTGRDAVPAGA